MQDDLNIFEICGVEAAIYFFHAGNKRSNIFVLLLLHGLEV